MSERSGLYRSRNGSVCGVLKGLADYFNLSLFWTRLIAVVAILLTGLWPGVLLYFLAALVMKSEPAAAGSAASSSRRKDFRGGRRRTAFKRIKKTRTISTSV